MNAFTNTDNTIDSLDIIGRIEELEALLKEAECSVGDNYEHDREELRVLTQLAQECKDSTPDWDYGATLVHRGFFKKYMDDIVDECYELPEDLPYWMTIKLDYDALEQDYTSVDFNGQEYLIR